MVSTDIVDRLRAAGANRVVVGYSKRALCAEAADEIEKLRAEVERLREWERRAVRSMDAACLAVGVEVCDQIPQAVARLRSRTVTLPPLPEASMVEQSPFGDPGVFEWYDAEALRQYAIAALRAAGVEVTP